MKAFLMLLSLFASPMAFAGDTVSDVMNAVLPLIPVGTHAGKAGADCSVVVADHRPQGVAEAEISILKSSSGETLKTFTARNVNGVTKYSSVRVGSSLTINLNQNGTKQKLHFNVNSRELTITHGKKKTTSCTLN